MGKKLPSVEFLSFPFVKNFPDKPSRCKSHSHEYCILFTKKGNGIHFKMDNGALLAGLDIFQHVMESTAD